MNKDVVTVNDKFEYLSDMPEFKEEILRTLRESVCEVTFTKVNGEQRVMPCTLKEDLLPAPSKETTFRVLKDRESDVISVWCTDKEAWRSFKLDNFIGIRRL